MRHHFLKAFLIATLTNACADFDIIDDIADFTKADVVPHVSSEMGSGMLNDPFLLDIAEALTIDLLDQRDPVANRSLSELAEWSSSDINAVAVDGGRVIALAAGTSIVTAAKRIEKEDRLIPLGEWYIEAFEFERIEIFSETGNFATLEGRQLQLSAIYYNEDNAPDSSAAIFWQSEDVTIAEVDESGLISARRRGSVSIAASTQEGVVVATVDFEVLTNDVDVFQVRIDNELSAMTLGDSTELMATAFSVSNVEIEQALTWTSSNPGTVAINAAGWAIASGLGTAAIVAHAMNGVMSDPLEVTVSVEATTVRSGAIVSARGGTSGTVTLFVDTDNLLKVRLNEDFFGANIPGPVLFLSNDQSSVSGGVRIGEIDPGDGENRVFEIPGNPGIDDFDYVIYYCEPFRVIYGSYLLE